MNTHTPFSWLIILLLFFCLPLKALGTEEAPELVPQLQYAPAEHRLTGKTVPNANISFSEFVADIVADEEGHFEVVIPADLKQSQLRVDDYLNNQFVELTFDFTTGTIATSPATSETAPKASVAPTEKKQTPSLPSATEGSAPEASGAPKKQASAVILWVVLLVLIVVATVIGLLSSHPPTKHTPPATPKKRGTRKRKRRRKRRSQHK